MPDEATEERLAQIERAHRRYAVARYAAEWAKDYGRDGGWREAMAVALSELLEWTEPADYEVTDDVINSERFRELWPDGAPAGRATASVSNYDIDHPDVWESPTTPRREINYDE